MELIHLPCLLRDTVFGWRLRRGNFSPFRARLRCLRANFLRAKACLTAIARVPKRYRSAQKRLDASFHLSPLIADGKRSYPQETRSFFNNVRSRLLTTCVRDSVLA